ncbi:MAG: transcriptional regulator [Candidatus Micrarchaeota archaeon]|nr:MAG: transcriptional regulator [Candidatus Micrarchaeota archaeon]
MNRSNRDKKGYFVCEICGREVSKAYIILIERSELVACEQCSKHNKIIKELTSNEDKKAANISLKEDNKAEPELDIVSNYAELLSEALKRKGEDIDKIADILKIKRSYFRKILNGDIKPDIETAKRLESYFSIKLIVEVDESKDELKQSKIDSISLEDFVKKNKEE